MHSWSIDKVRELLTKYYGFKDEDIEIESIQRKESTKPGRVRIHIVFEAPEKIAILKEEKE